MRLTNRPPKHRLLTIPIFQERKGDSIMKKVKILSGSSYLFLMICIHCIELGSILLCLWFGEEYTLTYVLLILCSIMYGLMLFVSNRIMTIVTYDPEKGIVSRRGFLGGFHRELCVANIIRTEIRRIPKEQEYILLIDKEDAEYYDSLSPNMPIRVPNTAKGRAFVANFYDS